MQNLFSILILLVIYSASVDSHDWTQGTSGPVSSSNRDFIDEFNDLIAWFWPSSDSSDNVEISTPKPVTNPAMNVCPFYKQTYSESVHRCWAWFPVELTKEKLPGIIELTLLLVDPNDVECNSYTCLRTDVNKYTTLPDLRNIQAAFFKGENKEKVTVGPLWVQREFSQKDELKIENLPGYYRMKKNKIDPVFVYFSPALFSGEQNKIVAKTLTTCWNRDTSATADERCSSLTITGEKGTIDISASAFVSSGPSYTISSASFNGLSNILKIRIDWKDKANACKEMKETGLNHLYVIVHEGTHRTDSLNMNQDYKPVLYFKSKDACNKDTDKLVEELEYKADSLGKQIVSLGKVDTTSGEDFYKFYPAWTDGKIGTVNVAITLCSKPPNCMSYQIHEVDLTLKL